jgi:hypothetical protein
LRYARVDGCLFHSQKTPRGDVDSRTVRADLWIERWIKIKDWYSINECAEHQDFSVEPGSSSCLAPESTSSISGSRRQSSRRHGYARVTSTFLGRLRSDELEPATSLALACSAAAGALPDRIMETAQLVQGDALHVFQNDLAGLCERGVLHCKGAPR